MDISSIFGNISEDDAVKAAFLKQAKQDFPHLMYDSIPIEWDENGKMKNASIASEMWGWQREVMYNLKPKETPYVISHLVNGMGKTYVITLSLALMLIDDHPSLSPGLMGIPGDIWLLTNTSLLKTEYPKIFFQSPALLGHKSIYDEKKEHVITNSRGETFVLTVKYTSEGILESISNKTNGKAIKFYSYSVNEQKLAGHNPISIFCDEFGDVTKSGNATGANRLTEGKMAEMLVRCGRNHLVGDNWVFCLFFTLTLGEAWVENLIEECRNGTACIPEMNRDRGLPDDFQNVHFIRAGETKSNPFINKSTISGALGFAKLAGIKGLEKRLTDISGDDPYIVFPRTCRPTVMSPERVQEIIKAAQCEPGWMLVESIDPGWRDKCAVIFALCHPLKGIYIIDEFYESGRTVPQVASVVKRIEHDTFLNMKVSKRFYDPNHIKKTTQESPVANYQLWRNSGLEGQAAYCSKDRAYDRMFELILKGLVHYYPTNCEGLARELRIHRKDKDGIPEASGANHSIDAMRHILNWFYDEYAKKIHLANPTPEAPISESRRNWLAQVAYYNQHVKPLQEESNGPKKIFGVTIQPLNTKNIRGF